jgi:hypothetical protein
MASTRSWRPPGPAEEPAACLKTLFTSKGSGHGSGTTKPWPRIGCRELVTRLRTRIATDARFKCPPGARFECGGVYNFCVSLACHWQ